MPLEIVREEKSTAHYGSKVNWGGIFSGAFVSLGLSMVFLLLGNATGLPVTAMMKPMVSMALKTGVFIYTACTLCLSFYFGGYTASRIAKLEPRGPGALYGLVSWAVAGSFLVIYGINQSMGFRQLLAGNGMDGANWLTICTAIVSGLLAAGGGRIGGSGAAGTRRETQGEFTQRAA